MRAEPRDPFYSPINGFSNALVPILNGFEKAQIETTLRGFTARGDTFPKFRDSDIEPSELGLYLNVAVRDASEIEDLTDRTEQKGAVNHRRVQIPAPKGRAQGIAIQFDYGRDVSADVIRAVDTCIKAVVNFSKDSAKP